MNKSQVLRIMYEDPKYKAGSNGAHERCGGSPGLPAYKNMPWQRVDCSEICLLTSRMSPIHDVYSIANGIQRHHALGGNLCPSTVSRADAAHCRAPLHKSSTSCQTRKKGSGKQQEMQHRKMLTSTEMY